MLKAWVHPIPSIPIGDLDPMTAKNPRRLARTVALQILYQYDLNSTPNHLVDDLKKYYDHFKVPENLREFVGQLVAGSVLDRQKIDELIEKNLSNWKLTRMSSVDRSLLRMATYEMQFLKSTPAAIVIDEAIEIAKEFGTAESPAFVNGILDSIQKSS